MRVSPYAVVAAWPYECGAYRSWRVVCQERQLIQAVGGRQHLPSKTLLIVRSSVLLWVSSSKQYTIYCLL